MVVIPLPTRVDRALTNAHIAHALKNWAGCMFTVWMYNLYSCEVVTLTPHVFFTLFNQIQMGKISTIRPYTCFSIMFFKCWKYYFTNQKIKSQFSSKNVLFWVTCWKDWWCFQHVNMCACRILPPFAVVKQHISLFFFNSLTQGTSAFTNVTFAFFMRRVRSPSPYFACTSMTSLQRDMERVSIVKQSIIVKTGYTHIYRYPAG